MLSLFQGKVDFFFFVFFFFQIYFFCFAGIVISCSLGPNVCLWICYYLGGEKEQIQHHPQKFLS